MQHRGAPPRPISRAQGLLVAFEDSRDDIDWLPPAQQQQQQQQRPPPARPQLPPPPPPGRGKWLPRAQEVQRRADALEQDNGILKNLLTIAQRGARDEHRRAVSAEASMWEATHRATALENRVNVLEERAAAAEQRAVELVAASAAAERRAAELAEASAAAERRAAELAEAEDTVTCALCFSEPRSALPPCGHLVMCGACMDKHFGARAGPTHKKPCVICRRKFQKNKVVRVVFS